MRERTNAHLFVMSFYDIFEETYFIYIYIHAYILLSSADRALTWRSSVNRQRVAGGACYTATRCHVHVVSSCASKRVGSEVTQLKSDYVTLQTFYHFQVISIQSTLFSFHNLELNMKYRANQISIC